ncbi:MAG: hypothetical protein IKU73_01925 [Clostridia bacterium]|nr:hypothetical protein [Clostridia bacterium]
MQPIIRPMLDFGPCVRQILQKRNISASEFARMMGYKSRNSIFRILDGEGGHGPRQALYDRLTSEDMLSLTQQERRELFQALEISRVGLVAFLNNRAMRELMMDVFMEEEADEIRVLSMDGRKAHVDGLYGSIDHLKEIEITITGCCDRQILTQLNERLTGKNTTFRITHFVYTGEEELIRNISAIQPLLYRSDYTAYAVEPGMFSRERQRLYRNNMIYVHSIPYEGRQYDRAFVMADKGCFLALKQRDAGSISQLDAFFKQDAMRMRPLKDDRNEGVADYVAYTEECLRMEQSRTMYTIKRDVPLSCVQTDILSQCVLEGFAAAGIAPQEEIAPLLEQLQRVHNLRFENHFTKRKPSHMVFDRAAMERFTQTGRQSDHFFAFRAYTPQERVRILTNLREQAAENPYFNVYFFKPEYEAPQMEIALFEGMGTLMAKPDTNYNLMGEHTETIITQESFCACYKNYYMQDLLERQVTDKQETLDILDQLIEMAKNA